MSQDNTRTVILLYEEGCKDIYDETQHAEGTEIEINKQTRHTLRNKNQHFRSLRKTTVKKGFSN